MMKLLLATIFIIAAIHYGHGITLNEHTTACDVSKAFEGAMDKTEDMECHLRLTNGGPDGLGYNAKFNPTARICYMTAFAIAEEYGQDLEQAWDDFLSGTDADANAAGTIMTFAMHIGGRRRWNYYLSSLTDSEAREAAKAAKAAAKTIMAAWGDALEDLKDNSAHKTCNPNASDLRAKQTLADLEDVGMCLEVLWLTQDGVCE